MKMRIVIIATFHSLIEAKTKETHTVKISNLLLCEIPRVFPVAKLTHRLLLEFKFKHNKSNSLVMKCSDYAATYDYCRSIL